MRELGRSFQVMAQGLAQLLATRAMIKREIGVTTTLIGGTDNNPLKHSADEHEAVLSLIRHRGPGYSSRRARSAMRSRTSRRTSFAILDGANRR